MKYLAFLLIGIAIGIYGFADYGQRDAADIEKSAPVRAQEREIPRVIEELPGDSGKRYLGIIREQEEDIASLKAEVARMKTAAQKPASENSQYEPMQTMSFEEMSGSLQQIMKNQFKNRIFTVPDEIMAQFKDEFLFESYSVWGMEYQDKMLDFLMTADTEGQFHLQSIECKTKICRLEVHTQNETGWQEIYSSMTHQDWYDSITIQETSDYPGMVIYYLTHEGIVD